MHYISYSSDNNAFFYNRYEYTYMITEKSTIKPCIKAIRFYEPQLSLYSDVSLYLQVTLQVIADTAILFSELLLLVWNFLGHFLQRIRDNVTR